MDLFYLHTAWISCSDLEGEVYDRSFHSFQVQVRLKMEVGTPHLAGLCSS